MSAETLAHLSYQVAVVVCRDNTHGSRSIHKYLVKFGPRYHLIIVADSCVSWILGGLTVNRESQHSCRVLISLDLHCVHHSQRSIIELIVHHKPRCTVIGVVFLRSFCD